MNKVRVLCLDIEGGHGGSSRSLFFFLKHIDRSRIEPEVWCRRRGPQFEQYQKLGIPIQWKPQLPTSSALPRFSRNLFQGARHALDFIRARKALAELESAAGQFDVVHFNHEGFAALAFWLRRKVKCRITIHMRTNVVASMFARLQMRLISAAADKVIFITGNEERNFRSLGGSAPGRVIFNPVEPAVQNMQPLPPRDGRFTIVSIGNAAVIRGTDRLLDIAEEFKRRGVNDVRFVVAGDMHLRGRWPDALRKFAREGGTLQQAVEERGLAEYFVFLGHVTEPERVLAGADVLVKPTRENNPWGRDILEAMGAGVPVASVGRDSTFVENARTGILQSEFDARDLAAEILKLMADRPRLEELGRNASERVLRLCDARKVAGELLEEWSRLRA